MSASCTNELSPLAFQLAARLEVYESEVEELKTPAGVDARRCRLLSAALEEIWRIGGALPQLAVDIVEMRFRHAALMRSLGRSAEHPAATSTESAVALARKQRLAVHATRQKCVRLFARN